MFLGKNIKNGQWTMVELIKVIKTPSIRAALEGWEREHDDWRDDRIAGEDSSETTDKEDRQN